MISRIRCLAASAALCVACVASATSCSRPFPEGDELILLLTLLRSDGRKFIFVTPQAHDGNFASGFASGIAGADAFCQQQKDVLVPYLPGFGFEYKALMVDSANRVATVTADTGDGQVNWVLKRSTPYYRPDGALLFGTNSAGLFVMSSGLQQPFTTDGAALYFTGLDTTWQNLLTCSNWGSTAGSGSRGSGALTSANALGGLSTTCVTQLRLLCVRQ